MKKTLALVSLLLAGCATPSPGTNQEEFAIRSNNNELADGIYRGPKNALERTLREKAKTLFSDTPGYHPSNEDNIGKYLTRPKLLHSESPVYPLWTRQAGLSAAVLLAVLIDKDGSIMNVKVVFSTDERFDDAAIDAVKKWKFTGGLVDGVPDTFTIGVPIKFILKGLPEN